MKLGCSFAALIVGSVGTQLDHMYFTRSVSGESSRVAEQQHFGRKERVKLLLLRREGTGELAMTRPAFARVAQ